MSEHAAVLSMDVLTEWKRLVAKHLPTSPNPGLEQFVRSVIADLGDDWADAWFAGLLVACDSYAGDRYPATDARFMATLRDEIRNERDGTGDREMRDHPDDVRQANRFGIPGAIQCPPAMLAAMGKRSSGQLGQAAYVALYAQAQASMGIKPFDGFGPGIDCGGGMFRRDPVHPDLLTDIHDRLPEEYWREIARRGIVWGQAARKPVESTAE